MRGRQHKPVAGGRLEPFLHLVGDLLGAAAKHRVSFTVPRPETLMKSRTVGFFFPEWRITPSRKP
jgi:hypothetical protein